MKERAVRFGGSASLVGVVAEPEQRSSGRPGIVFINSGILHHIGACRLHVRLARRLADEGFTSIRFDLSGIGDSESRRDTLTFDQSSTVEVREVMDHLTKTKGVSEFILIGLCSGADLGFKVSQADPRVIGLVQLDGFAYRTPGYYLRYYAPRMVSLTTWTNWIARRLKSRSAEATPAAPGEDYERPEYRRIFPPREVVENGLRALADRGVELLLLFSGGQSQHYNHRAQYRRSFRRVDFKGRMTTEYWGDADHLFSGLEHQRLVDDAILEWSRRFPERVRQEEKPAERVRVPQVSAASFRVRA